VHLRQIILELASELAVGDVVDDAGESAVADGGHATAHRAQMAVVVGAVNKSATQSLFEATPKNPPMIAPLPYIRVTALETLGLAVSLAVGGIPLAAATAAPAW